MRVYAITVRNFRNLSGRFPLCAPLAVLVGENNAGKSNVIDACRLLLTPESGPRELRWRITADDFAHDGSGTRLSDELELEAELTGLSDAECARMVTCLAPSLGQGVARLRVRARLRPDGRVDTQWYGGDSDHADIERWARDAVTYTYLHPLRDAAADLRPGRDNRLVGLLRSLAPDGHPDRALVEELAEQANQALDQVETIQTAKTRIQDQLTSLAGGGVFRQQTDLAFSPPRFERIIATLRALAGHLHPLEIGENGLGYNNLLYMAVLLAALAQPSDAALRVLLVEEPEAHLHPQLQDLLMRYLESQSSDNTQVIVTSHSPNFASAAQVERVTVLIRTTPTSPVLARAPVLFGMTAVQLAHLRRFLDVTKAALLFARGVILVEGIAEQLLVPVFAARHGRPLWRDGVTVINVGGVAFVPFVDLFGDDRLPRRCAIVSDSDPANAPDDYELAGSDPLLSPVARDLVGRQNGAVSVHLATRTLEWDLAVIPENWTTLLAALGAVKPRVADRLATDHAESPPETRADAFLAAARDVKGRLAQELAAVLADDQVAFTIPRYLTEAIEWVTAGQEVA